MQAGTLLDHLGSLHRAALDRLYGDKWTCQAILRALPATSRHYVLRLAGANGMLPVEVVKSWPLQRATALQKHEMILQQLCGLHLLREVVVRQQTHVSMVCYELHASFREQLRQSLCPSWNSEAAEGIGADKHAATAQQLERHAMSTWELLLQAVVQPPPNLHKVSLSMCTESLQDLLALPSLGLIERCPTSASPGDVRLRMSRAARAFLLLPTHEQVWRLILGYLELIDHSNQEGNVGARDATLAFLLRLGSMSVGRDCSVETLDDSQKRILKDLLLFGIVYQRKENSRRFYPTTLAVQLLSGSTGGGFSPLELGIGCLILETNFRLYAYTKSPLWPQVVPPALQLPPYARSHPLSYPNPIHH
mmetsp:Transcript_24851/g.56651  ORF Transcript_24851/g.56651 Transcript_24851/m.56651 type:complete len:364 (-) Transcript_24851:1071-2162(-)